jgi:hypothetical protein
MPPDPFYVPSTFGWFTTATTAANTYVTDVSFPKPQAQIARPAESKPPSPSPLDWLRSRVGEYVEAGALV